MSDKPIPSAFPVKSQKYDFGAEPRCRLFATSAGKGLRKLLHHGVSIMNNLRFVCTLNLIDNGPVLIA
jgi:hypothetical protein